MSEGSSPADLSMSAPAAAPGGEAHLSHRVAKGAGWIIASRIAMRVLGLVNTIVLARLLAPADFGLIAVAMTTVQLLQGLSDIGVSQTVVKFHDAGRDEYDTLLTLSTLRGLLVAIVMLVAAPIAASFYGDVRMGYVFAGIALYPLLLGLINPRFFEFERDIDFSKDFVSEVSTKLLSVVATLAVAFLFKSYWAIVLGVVVGAATQVLLSWAMRPARPRFTLVALKRVWGFSGWLAGVSFIVALSNKMDSIVLARTAGAVDTGKYYVGFQLAELPTTELAWPIARAVYPGLSAMQGDPERMRQIFLRGVEALAAIAFPAALGFAFVSQDLIHVLLGTKWDGSAHVVAWLTPAIGLQTVLMATQFYAMARGLGRLVFVRGLVMLLIKAPIFIWSAVAYGMEGAAVGAAVSVSIGALLNLGIYARASGRSAFDPVFAARRSFAASAAMAAFFFFLRPTLDLHLLPEPAFRLAIDIGLGAAVYLATLWTLWRLEGAPAGVERLALDLAAKAGARAFVRG